MHPVLFELHVFGLELPIRFFGLFIIDAFLTATLWTQWQVVVRRDPAIEGRVRLSRLVAAAIGGFVASRVVFLAVPGLSWGLRLGLILGSDFTIYVLLRIRLMKAWSERHREEADLVFNLAFWLLVFGFAGARLFWIITTPAGREEIVRNPLHALFAFWDGGIVYYGGLLCSCAFAIWYLWLKDRNIREYGDVLLTGVALTIFIGRWGCFSAGCDWGQPTEMPWGLTFDVQPESLIPPELQGKVAIHPSQLYLSLNGLLLFTVLAAVLARKRFNGQVIYLFLMLYPIGRSIAEHFRGDRGRGIYEIAEGVSLSTSQLISIPVFVVALVLYVRAEVRHRRRVAPAEERDEG